MNYSTIREIAEAVQKDVQNLLADIKGVFGDDFPEVHNWNPHTKLPDDTVTYKILELYNLKSEVSQQLPKGELTTLPEMMMATSQSQNYAVTQLVQDLRVSFADYLDVTLNETVITGFNAAKSNALDTLQNLLSNELQDIELAKEESLKNLATTVKTDYQKSEDLRGKLAVESYQRSLKSQELRSQMSELLASLKRY